MRNLFRRGLARLSFRRQVSRSKRITKALLKTGKSETGRIKEALKRETKREAGRAISAGKKEAKRMEKQVKVELRESSRKVARKRARR